MKKKITYLSFQRKFKSQLCSFTIFLLWNNFLWRNILYESPKSLQAAELRFLLLFHQQGWWWAIFSAVVCLHPLSHSHSSLLSLSLEGSNPTAVCAVLFCSIPVSRSMSRRVQCMDESRTEVLVWKVSLLCLKSAWTLWEVRSQCLLIWIIFAWIFSYQGYWINLLPECEDVAGQIVTLFIWTKVLITSF